MSKVLRQKEKFLYANDGGQSPAKKAKGKFPDIERALANWVKNEQRKGEPLTDAKIKDQAHRFAATVGAGENQAKLINATWLDKFKLKHNLLGARQRKGPSHHHHHLLPVHEPDGVVDSSTTSLSETPLSFSPVSSESGGFVSPQPTPGRDVDGFDLIRADEADALGHDGGPDYGHAHSRSATSMESGYTRASGPSLSTTITSPASPFALDGADRRDPLQATLPPLGCNYSRPRSQTFPNFSVEPSVLIKAEAADLATPRLGDRPDAGAMSESAVEESPTTADPRQAMKRNKSVPDIHAARSSAMQPPPVPPIPRSENTSPISAFGCTASPTQDDARRALDLVWSFFQNQPAGILEPDEYATIGKLMVKLKLSHSPDGTPILPGGLHPVDVSLSPRMTKKRTHEGLLAHDRLPA